MSTISIGKLVLDLEDRKTQEIMGKVLALVESSKIRDILKDKGFSRDLINQIVDCTTVQFLSNIYIKENMEEMDRLSIRVTDELVDKYAGFIDQLESFYTNQSEHPVEINEFSDFIDKSDKDMMKDIELIKFIVFLFNQNLASDTIWNIVEGNKAKQLIAATNLAMRYIVACSGGQNELSLINILTKQDMIPNMVNDALVLPDCVQVTN